MKETIKIAFLVLLGVVVGATIVGSVYSDNRKKETTMKEKIVSIMAEREWCKQIDGTFSFGSSATSSIRVSRGAAYFAPITEMSCVKSYVDGDRELKVTIFDYDF